MNKLNLLLILIITLVLSSCAERLKVINSQLLTNSKTADDKPYVLLISLDGFRWDYVDKYQPPNLKRFIEAGAKSESLIPLYPTKTFPNHYSIITGMYPDNHGLLDNRFYNYELDKTYSIGNSETVQDGRFYGGYPLWSLASNAGVMSASYFFIGSEAEIQGYKPSYYYDFDSETEKQTQIDQVVDWLNLPERNRPHFISLYFKHVDEAGHDWGPNDELKMGQVINEVDDALGKLFKEIEATQLDVNIIIVSDHGMLEIPVERYIEIEKVLNDELYMAVDNGNMVNIHPKNNSKYVFNYLTKLSENQPFSVFKTENVPWFERKPENKNWGEFQLITDDGYYFSKSKSIKKKKDSGQPVYGSHGHRPGLKDMHGIFYAKGSAFKQGYSRESFSNIHIYPLICKILGLEVPENIDGDLEVVMDVLKD